MRTAILLVLTCLAFPLGAQSRSVVIAHVVDAESGTPLPGAQLRITALQRVARSDTAGQAMLRGIPAGRAEIEVRRIGYVAATTEVTLSGRDTFELDIAMERAPLPMDTVRVEAAGPEPLAGLELFSRRRREGLGHYLAPEALYREGDRELATVVAAQIPGVRALTGTDGMSRYLVSTRIRGRDLLDPRGSADDMRRTGGKLPPKACVMHVYVDGIFLSDYDVSFIDTRSIAAVEVYGNNAPAELRRPGSDCGVVVLWTRRETGN